jgi:hypothetical protein
MTGGTAMSVVSHHHSSPWRYLREHVFVNDFDLDDFAPTMVVLLIAIAIAVAWFLPPALMGN